MPDSKSVPRSPEVAGDDRSRQLIDRLCRLTGLDAAEETPDVEWLLRRLGAFLELSRTISGTLSIQEMLNRTCQLVADILDAERCTVFLHDSKTGELFTRASMDPTMSEVRFPDSAGIAGHVFGEGVAEVIPDAYLDPRFNRGVDRETGFRTRNILCVPIRFREGRELTVGVAQALNKRGGDFATGDLELFESLLSHAAPTLLNAQLFEEINRVRNYNESILQSMTNGLLTITPDGKLAKLNQAAAGMLGADGGPERLAGADFRQLLGNANPWLREALQRVRREGRPDAIPDTDLVVDAVDGGQRRISVNVGIVPLRDANERKQGCLLALEDLTREKRVLNTMARYMSKEVAERVLQQDREVLGGTLEKVTVLFADIRDFTAVSESIGPQETVSLLNEYFTIMADIVLERGGVLDKYIGDSLMTLFGAPFPGADDADRAVAASLDMIEGLRRFNKDLQRRGRRPIGVGIGINTDEVVLGNIGSPKRMDFTVIGDGVNLASRLEGANKTYGTRILASEFTIRELRRDWRFREIDQIRVKGKTRPVTIFEILADDSPMATESALAEHRKALELYRARSWAGAGRHFAELLQRSPEDGVARIYIQRCRRMEDEPPAEDWDGVWTMTSK